MLDHCTTFCRDLRLAQCGCHRVRDEGQPEAPFAHAVGCIEFNSVSFEFLAKCAEICDLETDMVESQPFGRCCFGILFGKSEVHAREIALRHQCGGLIARRGAGELRPVNFYAELLRVPAL
jgi:hypothetical protein